MKKSKHAWLILNIFFVILFSDLHLRLQNSKRQERFTTFSDRSYLNSLSSCKRGMDLKKHKRDLHQTTTQPSTELHTNADWTPTDHYHWWLMMDLFNWSLIANDVMDRRMNVHWSHAARKWQKEKTLQSFFNWEFQIVYSNI